MDFMKPCTFAWSTIDIPIYTPPLPTPKWIAFSRTLAPNIVWWPSERNFLLFSCMCNIFSQILTKITNLQGFVIV